MRATVGSDFTVKLFVYGDDELLTNADVTPTVAVTDPSGAVVATGAVGNPSTGVYTAAVQARSEVTRLKVVWLYTVNSADAREVSYVDVDGSYLFPVRELRARPELNDIVRYPLDLLVAARDHATTFINDYTGSAFVETYAREVRDGNSSKTKVLLTKIPVLRIVSLTVNDVAVSTTNFKVTESGELRGPTTWQTNKVVGQNVVVEYVYGFEAPLGDMKRAALNFAASLCLSSESSIPDRARMMTTQWGTFQLSTASEDYPTGIPDVDAVLRRYKIWVPSFA